MRRTMRDMLIYYARTHQALLLVSSHNLKELEDLADKIGMLSEGALVFNDSTKHMREQFCTCHFRMPGSKNLQKLNAKLVEEDGDGYLCIIEAAEEDARSQLAQAGAEDIRIRPIGLEEFFRKERKEKEIDWKEIFG